MNIKKAIGIAAAITIPPIAVVAFRPATIQTDAMLFAFTDAPAITQLNTNTAAAVQDRVVGIYGNEIRVGPSMNHPSSGIQDYPSGEVLSRVPVNSVFLVHDHSQFNAPVLTSDWAGSIVRDAGTLSLADGQAVLETGPGQTGSGFRIERLDDPVSIASNLKIYFVCSTPGGVSNSEVRLGVDVNGGVDYLRFVRGAGAWVAESRIGAMFNQTATGVPSGSSKLVFCIEINAGYIAYFVSSAGNPRLVLRSAHALPAPPPVGLFGLVAAEITSINQPGDTLHVDDVYVIRRRDNL